MALIVGVAPGLDSKLSNEKLKAYKNFSNKLWNIARYVLSKEIPPAGGGEIDEKLKEEFDALAKDVTEDMDSYRFYIAAEKIYAYVWHRFADEILEESKKNPELLSTIYYILENSLKLLHPFMPFITEEIWQELHAVDTPCPLGHGVSKCLLMIEPWPIQ